MNLKSIASKYKQRSGSYSGEVTPVPISNTVVKLSSADGSRGFASARVGRRQAFNLYFLIEHFLQNGQVQTNIPLLIAGWSSLAARWAHNPKVGGSNPSPATNLN